MPGDIGVRCGLQVAREQRLKRYPGEFGPEQDICDVTGWLRVKYPLAVARVLVDRHYTQLGREISGFSVTSARSNQVSLAPKVHEVFLALGYDIKDTGGDSYRCQSCFGYHSNHETMMSYVRIETTLHSWRTS